MMKRYAPVAASILTSLLLVACSGQNNAAQGEGPAVQGRTFQSTEVKGHQLVDGTRITLTFPEAGKIGANAGCNHLFGDVVFEGDKMNVTGMGGTDMGCDQPRHAQDQWLTGFLQAKPKWSLDGEDLVLAGDGQEIKLSDRKVTVPDQKLQGTKWVVDTLIDGETVSSVPAGATAFMQFDGDKMTGNTGCNSMGGKVAYQSAKVEITEIFTTKMACEDARGQTERFVLDVLNGGPLTTKVDGNHLELKNGKGKGLRLQAQS